MQLPRGTRRPAKHPSPRLAGQTVAVALIDFTAPDRIDIRHVERYSGNHVEARPLLYSNGNFRMSAGKVEFKTVD